MAATSRMIRMRLRLIKSISTRKKWNARIKCFHRRGLRLRNLCVPWRQSGPQNVKCGVHAGIQSCVAMKRPEQERSKNSLSKDVRDLRRWKIPADFASLLPKQNNFRVQGAHAFL